MSRMVVARVALHRGKLPNGKFLGLVAGSAGHYELGLVAGSADHYALMLVNEKTLDSEILTGQYGGPNLYRTRTNAPIPENEALSIGDYLGSLGEAHYFIWTGEVP